MTLRAFVAAVMAQAVIGASALADGGSPPHTRDITLAEAVRLAVSGNLEAAVARLDVSSAEKDVIIAEADFDPSLAASLSAGKSRTPSSSAFASPSIVESDSVSGEVAVTSKIETGADLKVSVTAADSFSNSDFQSINPAYETTAQLSLTQPLLKNAGAGVARWKVTVNGIKRESVALKFKASISDIVTKTVEAYWDLVYLKENVKAQEEARDRAVDLVRRTEAQVRAGTLPPMEITSAKASAASWEEKAIAARNDYENGSDALLKLLGSPEGPLKWSGLVLNPVEAPVEEGMEMEIDRAVETAIRNRPEVAAAKKDLEKAKAEFLYYENQRLPGLDLSASVTFSGTRGSAKDAVSLTGETGLSPLGGDAWAAAGDMASLNYYDYSVGIKLTYPLNSRGAEAQAAVAGFGAQSALIKLKTAERDAALEAREAVRSVISSKKRLEAARAARILGEERLSGEMRKFDAGVTTLFATLEYQKDLAAQKAAELSALADLQKAYARLSKSMGLALEKNGVELDVKEGL